MVTVGYALSSEDHGPQDLVRFAALAEEHGFTHAWISDHYHPWIDEQGHSPFVWGVLGAIAASTQRLRIGTGVTCPTVRVHPAIIAQAAATASLLLDGRFFLGVGSGENLNEHILGDAWPPAPVRLEMLEEAVAVLRLLWQGGEQNHRGEYYDVEDARVYDLPQTPPPIYMSAFGPQSVELAARVADGYVGTSPSPELLRSFTQQAGPDKPKLAGAKCCWGPDEQEARKLAYRLWPNMGLPGQLSQEIRTPKLFEAASSIVSQEQAVGAIPCGPDPRPYVDSIRSYAEAGYDEVYVHNIGSDQEGFLRFFAEQVVPQVAQV